MNERYKSTQLGTYIIITYILLFIFIIGLLGAQKALIYENISYVLVIEIILLLLFVTLSVKIDEEYLVIKFGIGVIKKRFKLNEIESCKAVKNPWYYFWGIKKIPNGWLFSVSGNQAVEIKMKKGKIFRIGTNKPQELEKAINQALGK